MRRTLSERFKTYGNVFDHFTVRTVIELSSKLDFDAYSLSPLFIGKESNVFLCERKDDLMVLKLYRLESCDFNRMYDYIRCDPRFTSLKRQRRKVIFAWAQREYRNLHKAREGGVRVPTPYAFLNNVLAMEMVGDEDPASKAKDNPPADMGAFFRLVVEQMKLLHKAGLVHGDLSPFNILNHRDAPVLIDFSQATPTDAPNSMELLTRDVRNVCKYFVKSGVPADQEQVKAEIIAMGKKPL